MARKVFFSFHYDRDVFRVMQVRNSWVVRPGDTAQPFYDKAEFEEAKRRAGGVEKWIEDQLAGTSVTVVLYGADTSNRPWVKHEIKRSHALGKGQLAIAIHKIRDPRTGTDVAGVNPLSRFTINRQGATIPLSRLYHAYDWVNDNGRQNMPAWIEAAARAAGR
jgi:hypothetical protein